MEPPRDEDPKELGGFALVCRIGAGGMGQVFLGESAAGHRAAVKVIKPSVLDEDTRVRFLSEVDGLRTVYGHRSSRPSWVPMPMPPRRVSPSSTSPDRICAPLSPGTALSRLVL